MHFSLVTVCSLLTAAIVAPTANPKRHVVHERREGMLTQWQRCAKIYAIHICQCELRWHELGAEMPASTP